MRGGWIALGIVICFIVFSYYKHYTLKVKLILIGTLIITSLVLMLPIFPFTIITLLGLFLFERLWLLLALILIIEMVTNTHNRILMAIFSAISIIVYLFLRTRI